MKHSISFRFTMIFIGLMSAMIVVIWIANNWLLESFYIDQKVKVLENAYARINEIAENELDENDSIVGVLVAEIEKQRESDEQMIWNQALPRKDNRPAAGKAESGMEPERENYAPHDSKPPEPEASTESDGSAQPLEQTLILGTIRELSEKNNVSIVMINSDTGNAVYPTTREGEWLAFKVQRYTLGHNASDTEILKQHENYMIEKSYDPRSKSYFLESWGFFDDNQTLYIMSMPLASIQDSVNLSNQFLSYVGFAALIIGCVLMYATTRRITSPIKKLAALSEEMSNLNFEAKYEGSAEDEIGVLGHSMNTLSDRLKNSITELKNANNELQKDIEKQIKIDEMRKDFIANVSHELKTPIALIQGYAEGLTEGMAEEAESRDYYCEVIMDEANKMNKMVRQLLNLTALEFGNDSPNIERFDLVEVIRQLVMSADILIQQNHADVSLEMPQNCFVWADEFKVEEILTNYFSNAINHLSGERQIIIKVEPGESDVRVSVFNTGLPIPDEDIPNLWTKFYKVDKARTRAYGGSGIGLSIVKAIMDAHHKPYGVENKENGVEFWFALDTKSHG